MSMLYLWEKCSQARRDLMLPHPDGEAASIAEAYWKIHLSAKMHLDRENLDDDAKRSLARLDELMDTTGLKKPTALSNLHQIRAEQLTQEEQAEFSTLVDHLCGWFDSAANKRK